MPHIRPWPWRFCRGTSSAESLDAAQRDDGVRRRRDNVPVQVDSVRPLVSAIIPAHNAERFLAAAIDSVLAQTYQPIECIVVDDGSTDGTPAVARSYGDRIRLIPQEQRGVSAARNRGAAEARGELLAFLDADDRWLPERVERQARELEDITTFEA